MSVEEDRFDIFHMQSLFRKKNAEALASKILERAMQGESAEHIARITRYAVDPQRTADNVAVNPIEWAFLNAIFEVDIRERQFRSGSNPPTHHRKLAGSDLDRLSIIENSGWWSAAQWLNFLRLRCVVPSRGPAVVVTMRDDGLSALQWIAHYRALGFDGVYVYSNDNVDGSDGLLQCLADHGEIVLIENDLGAGAHPQRKAYAHALHMLPELRDHEWVFFLDSDEFFVPDISHGTGTASVLAQLRQKFGGIPPSSICYHWR